MGSSRNEFITALLIQLVLTIPFYVASANAEIQSVSVKGKDGFEGYARIQDFLEFRVKASIDGDKVISTQVILTPDTKFDRCSGGENGSDCTLRLPTLGTETFDPRNFQFSIDLLKPDGASDDSESGDVTIDNSPPSITFSLSKESFNSNEPVRLSYQAADTACEDPSCGGKCVGLKSIEFFTLDGKLRKSIRPVTDGCAFSGAEDVDAGIFRDGLNSIFAKVTDNFNQINENSVSFNVDAISPVIVANSFEILRKGIPITTFSANSVPVTVSVNISAPDIDLDSVTANLTGLSSDESLVSAKARCAEINDGLNMCEWAIELNPQEGGLRQIVINASDLSGNSAGTKIEVSLSPDDAGPVVQSLSTSTSLGRRSGNTVIASFNEATGMSAKDAILHVGGSSFAADKCSNEDGSWRCFWDDVEFGSGEKIKVSIQSDTKDLLDNPAEEETISEIRIDDTAPVLISINLSPVGGESFSVIPGVFRVGDKISVLANLTESSDLKATADFSRFIIGQKAVQGTCGRVQADEHLCSFTTESINIEAADAITFNFTDSAGNFIIETASLKTFGLENATAPDFWTSEVSCSPSSIDRTLGPLTNLRVFCHVKLKQRPSPKPVSTLFISPASCVGDTALIESTETSNSETGSTHPIIRLTLKKDEMKIDSLNFTCSLNIFSKIGDLSTVTRNPEVESVRINLSFFNLPLGELDEELKKKIEDAKKDTEGILSLIGTLNKIVNIAKKICQIYGILYNIGSLFVTIQQVLDNSHVSTCANPFGITICPTMYTMKTKTCMGQQGLETTTDEGWKIAKGFCKFVNCENAWLLEPVRKWSTEQINKFPGAAYASKMGSGEGGYAQFMDPQGSLIVSTAFACLPGIIYNLDKYRQIKCLYADCLQTAVAKQGIPITACEDQKAYATCKYVTGEVFAILPPVAFINHWLKVIKQALSNPFGIIGLVAGALCVPTCPMPAPGSSAAYTACEVWRFASKLGDVIGNVKSIIDEGFKIREDYCSRLKDNEVKPPDNNATAISGT